MRNDMKGNDVKRDGKRKGFIVLGLTAALGAGVAMYWSQQQSIESDATLSVSEIIDTSSEKQMPVASKKKVEVKATADAVKQSEKARLMRREEAIAKASRELRESSGFVRRIKERNRIAEARLDLVQAHLDKNPGHNANIKKHLNIDTKETFNIDYDAKMKEVQRKRQQQDSAELERRLVAWGAKPKQVDEINKFRQKVLDMSTGE